MSSARRPHLDQRRRMVIYSQQREDGDLAKEVARSNRASDELYSRRNTASYGSRVHRRLRARWYGLVPVKRRTLIGFVASLCGLVALLAWGHWASLWWAPVAMRPDVARPLQLDRPDSFGAWFGAVFLAMTSGAAFLVYQLRRYRSDDYRGHYRLWRIVIVVAMLASIDSVTQLTDWLGATLDAIFGQREIMAGSQWVRILWTIGGAAFAIRLTGEVWKDRSATSLMVVTWSLFAIPAATHWNLIRWEMERGVFWLPVIALAARTLMFATVVTYLRTLYREVRGLAEKGRLQDLIRAVVPQGWARRSREESLAADDQIAEATKRKPRKGTDSDEERPAATGGEDAEERRGWWGRWRRGNRVEMGHIPESQIDHEQEDFAVEHESYAPSGVKPQGRPTTVTSSVAQKIGHDRLESSDGESQSSDGDSTDGTERKQWWSMRMPKWSRRAVANDGSEDSTEEAASRKAKLSKDNNVQGAGDEADPTTGKLRNWWPLGLKSKALDSEDVVLEQEKATGEAPGRRRWAFGKKGGVGSSAETHIGAKSDETSLQDASEEQGTLKKRTWWPVRFSRSKVDLSPDDGENEDVTDSIHGSGNGSGKVEPKRTRDERPRESHVSRKEQGGAPHASPSKGPLPVREAVRKNAEAEYGNDGYDETDDDDSSDPQYANMSKAERRRLRKLQKRQGRAA